MWGLSYVAALLLVLPPVSGPAWHGVLSDRLEDGRFDQPHSCGAAVVAWTRTQLVSWPGPEIPDALRREVRRACGHGDPARIRLGMSDAAVAAVAGLPRLPASGPRCWVYPTRRVCFAGGRVQLVSHG